MRECFPFLTTKRLGLLHPDGTLTVCAPDMGLEQARREAVDFDENQTNLALFTKVIALSVEDIKVLEVLSLKAAPKKPLADPTRGFSGEVEMSGFKAALLLTLALVAAVQFAVVIS